VETDRWDRRERDATYLDGVNRWISRVIQRASFFLFSFGRQEIVFIVIYLTNVEMRNSLYNNTEKKKKRCFGGDVYGDRFFGGSKDALSYSSETFFFLACPFRRVVQSIVQSSSQNVPQKNTTDMTP
jgi:hypothetical protein